MMKSRWVAAMALVLLMAPPASADQGSVADPRDPDQSMDPVEVTYGHHERFAGVLAHTVIADGPWADGNLYSLVLRIWLPNRTKAWDRKIVVTANAPDEEGRSSWTALVYDKKGRVRGHANTWRPDMRSLRIEFSRWLLGSRFGSYRWVVRATVACQPAEEGHLCGGPKLDRIPDRGKVQHKL